MAQHERGREKDGGREPAGREATGANRSRGARLTGLGIEFAAAVGGLTVLGVWIDRRFETAPWGVLIGAGIGLIGGTYNMIRDGLRAGRRFQSGKTGTGGTTDSGPEHE